MNAPQDRISKLPMTLRIVAGYFVLIGMLAMLLAMLRPAFGTTAGTVRPNAYDVGRHLGAAARFIIMYVIYVVSGIGLFRRRGWARKLGLFLLAANTFYCLLYTSDAADEEDSVDLGGRRII